MAGLLEPRGQGLLALAAGMMSPTLGGSFGGALGQGLQGYQQAYGSAQRLANEQDRLGLMREKYAFEMEGAKEARAKQKKLDDLMAKALGFGQPMTQQQVEQAYAQRQAGNRAELGLPDGGWGAQASPVAQPRVQTGPVDMPRQGPIVDQQAFRQAAMIDPQYAAAIQNLVMPQQRKVMNVNGKLVYEDDPGKVVADYSKPEMTPIERTLEAAGIPRGSPEWNRAMQGAVMKATTHAPSAKVTVNPEINLPKQEGKQSEAYGKSLGEIRANIMQAGLDAQGRISNYRSMGEALRGLEGGNLSGAKTAVASALNSLGIQIDPRLGDKEFAESMGREIAASMRQTGTGPMTDKDFENFLRRVPDLSKSEAGRQQIIQTAIAKAERDQKVMQMAMEYAKANNNVIDDEFLVQVSKFVADTPVVARDAAATTTFGDGWSMRPVQ